jgi:hypothetical protein
LGDVSCPHVLEGTGMEVMFFSWERHDEDKLAVADGLFRLRNKVLFAGDLCSIYAELLPASLAMEVPIRKAPSQHQQRG